MKHRKSNLRGLFTGVVVAAIVLSSLLTSCAKLNSTSTAPPTALVTIIHAAPTQPGLDVYLNSDKANNNALNYGEGVNYFSAFAGLRTVNFYNFGTTSPTVASAQVAMSANMAYTIFLDNSPKPGILTLTDSLIKPEQGKAGVRFVNLSPDSAPVDLVIQGGATITSNKSFEGHTGFLPVTGQNNFVFQVVKSGTSTVLATLSGVNLTSGYLYTVMLEGLNNTTNASLKPNIIMITNAYFN